jgi:hypothetical protein
VMVFGPGNPGQRPSRKPPQKLLKNNLFPEFHTPSSPWRHHITSTCPTMRMTSLRIPDDTDKIFGVNCGKNIWDK